MFDSLSGIKLEASISVEVGEDRRGDTRGEGEGDGVGSESFVELGDEGIESSFDLVLDGIFGRVGLGRGHGGDVNDEVIGVDGEVHESFLVEEDGEVEGFERVDDDFEGDFGEGDVGVEGEDGRLVSRGGGEVDQRLGGEVDLDLVTILVGIKFKILEVVGNSEKHVVDKRIRKFKSRNMLFKVINSKRKRIIRKERSRLVVGRTKKNIEDSLEAKTREFGSGSVGE